MSDTLKDTFDGIAYELVEVPKSDGVPWQYRCAWDDRFAFAAAFTKLARSQGNQIAINFSGESLQIDNGSVLVYKTAIVNVLVWYAINATTQNQLIPDKYIDALKAINEKQRIRLRDGKWPIESLPPGWIDRGAISTPRSPGTWFQSQKWDLCEYMIEDRKEWGLFSRPHGEPSGCFSTKEEAFACADGIVPEGCIKVNVEPTNEQLRVGKKPKFSLLTMVERMYQEQETNTSNLDPKQETWRDRKPLL